MIKNNKRYLVLLLSLAVAVGVCLTVVYFFHLPPLSVFKYASLFVASASTVWGLMHELYTKDNLGKRQLLPEGKISIAVAIVSLLCSAIGSVADDVVKHNADVSKASKDRIKENNDENARHNLEMKLAATQNNTQRILLDEKVLKALATQSKAIATQNGAAQRLDAARIRLDNKYQNESNRRQAKEASLDQKNLILQSNIRATAQNAVSLHQTLSAIKRAVDPVNQVSYSIQVQVPLNDPQLASYKTMLLTKYAHFIQTARQGGNLDTDPDFATGFNMVRDANGHMVKIFGVFINNSSTLFPSQTDPVSSLIYYPVDLLFWPPVSGSDIPAQLQKLRATSLPEMEVSLRVSSAPPTLMFLPQSLQLILTYTATLEPLKEGRFSVTLPDLDGKEVQVTRAAFYDNKNREIITSLTDFQKRFYVDSVRFGINGQMFYFDHFDLKHYSDSTYGDACYFVFRRNYQEIAAYKAHLNE